MKYNEFIVNSDRKTRIWILNHYAGSMFFDRGGRHYNFAKYLRLMGYESVVFCSNAKHNSGAQLFFDTDKLWHEHLAEEINTPFVFVKSRAYVGNGKQRALNMLDFYRNVKQAAKEYAKLHGKPDIILASSVHPLTLVAGLQLAKHFGVRCICEVRDLWPESIVAYGIAGPHNPAVLALRRLEKWIYKKADAIVFTMEGAYDYIIEQGWEKDIPRSKVHYINNGVDLEVFDYNKEHFQIDDPDLENPDTFKVVYTGSIRRANEVGRILDIAKRIKDKSIHFLIWGAGDDLPALKQRVIDEDINNVSFKGKVEKKYVPYIVSKADLTLVHWGDVPLIKYGASYNKLFEYLAAGRPVYSTVKPGYSIIERYQCGKEAKESIPECFSADIEKIAQLHTEKRLKMGENARKAAYDYDFGQLSRNLEELIKGL